MSSAKSKKHPDRAFVTEKREKITNDLLLQFAYTLTICVLSIYVYNATALVQYGNSMLYGTRGVLWVLFFVFLVLGIFFTCLYKTKNKDVFKNCFVYSFVTAFFMFWYVGLEKIPFYMQKYIPFLSHFSGRTKVLIMIFPVLGILAVLEFVIYFVRYYRLNRQ